jgi:hypothetical protein
MFEICLFLVFLSIERRVLSLSLHLWKAFGAAAGLLVAGPIWS